MHFSSILRQVKATFALITSLFSTLPSRVAAQVYSGGGVSEGINKIAEIADISQQKSITEIVLAIIALILNLAGVLAVLAIIIAGAYLIVSNGDEGQKDKAKKIITYVVIGLLVIILARVIVLFVGSILSSS